MIVFSLPPALRQGSARAALPSCRQQLYRWRWRAKLPERHGELARVLVRGKLNSILVEFLSDGWRVVTSRYAVRKA